MVLAGVVLAGVEPTPLLSGALVDMTIPFKPICGESAEIVANPATYCYTRRERDNTHIIIVCHPSCQDSPDLLGFATRVQGKQSVATRSGLSATFALV